MYKIDRQENRITKLEQKTFSELKFKEREHLQEWIANNPSSLGEELLIIQKEFSGFNDTNERLDLLAIDKAGNLVIIENKLDDSGKDVTWQTIKYASYCSSLTKQEITKIFQDYLGSKGDAKEKLSEFFDGKEYDEILLNQGLNSQRLIMVAAKFRKEVTSSVLWLMNFKMKIQCFKVTPYELNNQLFLNIEQILPTKDTEDFTISMASKAQEENEVFETLKNRHKVRLKFWEQFIGISNQKSNVFSNNSPTKENWIATGLGISGITLYVSISRNYCACGISINKGNKELNKEIFGILYKNKDEIEKDFGDKLTWDNMEGNKTSAIYTKMEGVNYFDGSDWEKINDFLIVSSTKLDKAIKEPMKKLSKYLKDKK